MKFPTIVFLFLMLVPITGEAQTGAGPAAQRVATATDRGFLQQFSRQQASEMRQQLEVIRQQPGTAEVVSDPGNAQWVSTTTAGHRLVIAGANLNAAKTVSTNKVWPAGILGLNLTGSGTTLAVWDGGKVRATHQEFGGRVTQKDGATSLNAHATHVAGTMIASGVDPDSRGMAYQASLDAYDWLLDVAEMSAAAADGLLISNHSYRYYAGWQGSSWYGDTTVNRYEDNGFGLYHSSARYLDLIANHAPYYLMCFAASNDRLLQPSGGKGYVWAGSGWVWSNTVRPANGPYDCIPYFNTAKNILTVGNVNDIPGGYSNPSQVVLWSASSCGPTDDGRIKPDLVANGISVKSTASSADNTYTTMTGTSMSTPNTSGSLGLLQQHALNLYGGYLKAATLKALVIHTADEAGSSDGPDYKFGWGLLNTATAAQLMLQKGSAALISETTLGEGETFSLPVYSDGSQPLRITIAWNDPAGEEAAWTLDPGDLRLVNDLDLRLSKDASQWEPYTLDPANPETPATTGDNFRDNVEQVLVVTPTAGLYTITVSHKALLQEGEQEFALIVSGLTQFAPTSFEAITQSSTQVDLSWALNSSYPVLLAWSADNVIGQPSDGVSYSVGDILPGGGTVLYTGTNTSYSHTGLTAGTRYHYRIWSLVNETPGYSTSSTADAATWCSQPALPIAETMNNNLIPPCWITQTDGSAGGFYHANTNYSGGESPGEIIHFYEYLNGLNNYTLAPNVTSRLIMPPVNTIGIGELTLQFRFTFRDSETWAGLAPVYARVQTSNDGISWTNTSWSYASRTGTAYYQLVNVPITNHLNAENTFIAFTLQGDPSDFWYWTIDDVHLAVPATTPRIATISLLPEALWNGTGLSTVQQAGMPLFPTQVADQLTVELHDQSDYSTIVYTRDSIRLRTSGLTRFTVPAVHNDAYYITLRHRNSIETTSMNPVSFSSGEVTYDFTTAAGKAYGNNLKSLAPGVFGLFSGDVNGDGVIDGTDGETIGADAAIFKTGYHPTDLNGDGIVDAPDLIITDNNAAAAIERIIPD